MESPTLSNAIVACTNKDIIVDNEMETVHRKLIQSIMNLMPDHTILRVSNLPSRIICMMSKVDYISYEDLKRIYLLGDRVQIISLHLKSKSIEVCLKKSDTKNKIIIKKSRPQASTLEQCTKKILNAQVNVREADYRMCYEIIKMIFRWTWNKVAAKITIQRRGGEYHFQIHNLRTVTYKQLTELDKVHDAVQAIQMYLKQGFLQFRVTQTDEYISQEKSAKKRKM